MFQQRLMTIFQRINPYVPHVMFGVLAALLILLAVNDRNFRPLRNKAAWNADSNYSKAGARFAIDRDLETWWSSYYPMTFGMWMQVDVGRPVTLNGVTLRVNKESKEAQPKEWVVKVSRDGSEWKTVNSRDSAVDGTLLLIPFAAVSARYIQIIQTTIATTPSPWRIYELDLLQPVVPWQFPRSTLISVIIGWLFFMIAVLLFRQRSLVAPLRSRFGFSEPAAPAHAVVAMSILAVVLLMSWGLSVYHAEYDELSPHESQYVKAIAFGRHSTGEWLSAYFQHVKTGAYWLSLLAVRLIYNCCRSQLAAFRMIPAMFGVGSLFLIFLTWRAVSRSHLALWEALTASALFGLTGWTLLLHREGDFSAALVFFGLLETWLSFYILHDRPSVWLTSLFSVVSLLGVCVHPGLFWLPVGVLFFEAWHLWLCAYAPNWLLSSDLNAYRFSDHRRKIVWYLLALLPMLGYGIVTIRQPLRLFQQIAVANLSAAINDFPEILRVCGFSGIAGMICFSAALLGGVYVLSERRLGEWFFLVNGSVFVVILAVISPEYLRAARAFLLLLMTLLCAKGLNGTVAFLTPRHTVCGRQILQALCLIACAGYSGVFAANTLFWGNARLPYDSQTYAEQQTRRQLRQLTDAIHADSDDCKTMATFTEHDKEMLASIYHLPIGVANFKELWRVAVQGIFVVYLFADTTSAQHPEVADFLRKYYEKLGASRSLAVYHIRREFRDQPQRYYPEDLFANTGRGIQDQTASRGVARETTSADKPGLLSFGPFCRVCQPGRYIARFALQTNEPVYDTIATLKVVEGTVGTPVSRTLTGRELFPAGQYHLIDVPFTIDFTDTPAYQMKRYQFFTETTGAAGIRLNYIELLRQEAEVSPQQ
ncbi:putative Glycosyl hydrolase [Candidatus Moduliflexus flocculans]|uniref:Putative Glycosyl hydrolase n=1 Tax=Candidatus Moduliflexus flocculans TaxID=1499966 RepID=A0A081BQT0_9BACT|nr:putative Glycosyl hydrolase [Candidatus Moduliflexus flocculans]